MLRTRLVPAVLAAVALLATLAPSVSNAQFKQGDWELTLNGTGASNKGFTAGSFGVSGSLGYFILKPLEISLRQSATYSGSRAGSSFVGVTRVAADYHFDLGRFQPFVGGNIGYVYGHPVSSTWEAAPEAGVKYFLNSTTFVFGMVEYQFLFRSGNQIGNNFKHGQLVYTIGLGLRL